MSSDLRTTVRAFLAESFDNDILAKLTDESSLMRSGLVDSAGMIALVSFLETTFSMTISDEEFDPANLDSLVAIDAFVKRKQSRQP